jgi:DNA modification methylase
MTYKILVGDCRDCLKDLDSEIADCVVTSPDYWQQRGSAESAIPESVISLEKYAQDYLDHLLQVFNGEIHRVLKDTGVLFIVINDSYNTPKVKNTNGIRTSRGSGTTRQKNGMRERGTSGVNKVLQSGIMRGSVLLLPERLIWGMIDSGKWSCKNKIIWLKRNGQPNTAPRSRYGLNGYEHVYMLVKSSNYYNFRCPQVPRNKPKLDKENPDNNNRITKYVRDVWPIPPQQGSKEKHYSTFPIILADRCITSACPIEGTVLDPFCGSATTGAAALLNGRKFIGVELEPHYAKIAHTRLGRLATDKEEYDDSLEELKILRKKLIVAETNLFPDDSDNNNNEQGEGIPDSFLPAEGQEEATAPLIKSKVLRTSKKKINNGTNINFTLDDFSM